MKLSVQKIVSQNKCDILAHSHSLICNSFMGLHAIPFCLTMALIEKELWYIG